MSLTSQICRVFRAVVRDEIVEFLDKQIDKGFPTWLQEGTFVCDKSFIVFGSDIEVYG